VINTRKSIRNSESPKLYSKSPAASIADSAASPVAGEQPVAVSADEAHESEAEAADEPQKDDEGGDAALGRDLHGHVVQVRVHRMLTVVGRYWG
jgi:hypothetical protein